MEDLRKRFLETQLADFARNKLIEDLLQQLGDTQKAIDRNAFTLVLIDGNGINFLDELVTDGVPGGTEASNRLRKEVFNELRFESDFKHGEKIITKVFVDMRALSRTYAQTGLLAKPEAFADFVAGFNESHPFCEILDGGARVEEKMRANLNLHVNNVHCKHIVFGASTDEAYASFLAPFPDDDVAVRLRLLRSSPVAATHSDTLHKFRRTEFAQVFRSGKLPSSARKVADVQDLIAIDPSEKQNGWHNRHAVHSELDPTTSEHGSNSNSRAPTPSASESPWTVADRVPKQVERWKVRPKRDTASSWRLESRQSPRSPDEERVNAELVQSTRAVLARTPESCNFNTIRRRAERQLGLSHNFLGMSASEPWFNDSKRPIKWAVEEWMERTNGAPPGNATWLLKHFHSPASPAEILKSPLAQRWRTPGDPSWSTLPVREAPAAEYKIERRGSSWSCAGSSHGYQASQDGW